MFRATDLAPCNETYPGADITTEQWEFMQAIENYKRRFHRRFPTWREVLHVALCLGYRRVAKATDLDQLPVDNIAPPPTAAMLAASRREDERRMVNSVEEPPTEPRVPSCNS